MDLEQFAYAGEFLGGIGVIVSLVYLASQIRGSTRSQRAENYGRSLEQLANMQARFATETNSLSSTWSSGRRASATLFRVSSMGTNSTKTAISGYTSWAR